MSQMKGREDAMETGETGLRPGSATPRALVRLLARAFALGVVGLGLNLMVWLTTASTPRGDALDLHGVAELGAKIFGAVAFAAAVLLGLNIARLGPGHAQRVFALIPAGGALLALLATATSGTHPTTPGIALLAAIAFTVSLTMWITARR